MWRWAGCRVQLPSPLALTADVTVCSWRFACGMVMVVWPALCGRCEVATLCRAKVLFGLRPESTTAAPFLASCPPWRRRRGGVLAPPPGFSGGNPDPSRDRARATLSCVVWPPGSSPWMLRRPEGSAERVGCWRRRAVWLPRLGGQADTTSVLVCSG